MELGLFGIVDEGQRNVLFVSISFDLKYDAIRCSNLVSFVYTFLY